MSNVIYETDKVKVIEDSSDTYRLLTVSTRCLDGIMDTGWYLHCTYGRNYCRDWLGRVCEYRTPHDPRADAMEEAMSYEQRH